MTTVYVSITGLRVKRGLAFVRFWWLAILSMAQANKARGNLHTAARSINGVNHTLTIWTDEAAMRAFLVAGAHRKAMRASRSIGTGRTYGYLAEQAPDWDTALALWQSHGKDI